MKSTVNEFRAYRKEMNDRILNSGFRDYNKFFALDNKAYINGALSSKTKELMGLSSSMVLRCNDCILYHIDRSIEEGATQEELYETFNRKNFSKPRLPKQSGGQVASRLLFYNEGRGLNTSTEFYKNPSLWEG